MNYLECLSYLMKDKKNCATHPSLPGKYLKIQTDPVDNNKYLMAIQGNPLSINKYARHDIVVLSIDVIQSDDFKVLDLDRLIEEF